MFGVWCFSSNAEVPEPDNLIYGVIQLGVSPVTAANTSVLVEARKTSTNGPVVATYRMGESVLAGNFYSLRIPLEAFNPLTDTNASRVGGLIYLSVRDDSGVRVRRTASIASRGKLTRLDFTEPDSDGDGLPDTWEQQYFGNPTIANPNADPDGDGRNNLQEYLAGTNPLIPDGRHPADNSPANNVMTFTETETYADAWLAGTAWPNAPTNIPIAYVTKAALLAVNGGTYVFTNAPPTNAPHWWVNVPPASAVQTGTNFITSTLPVSYFSNTPLDVLLHVLPAESTHVYAVEDQVPANWEVSSISHGGSFDAANHKVKWGPFYDSGERDLTYQIVPAPTNAPVTLSGLGSFDGLDIPITGDRVVTFGSGSGGLPLRWAYSAGQGLGSTHPVHLLIGEANHPYVLECSTNLAQWDVLQTISTDGNGRYFFSPTNSAATPHHFYRARTP